MTITPEQLKANFRAQGKTVKSFAEENGYPYHEVIRVIAGVNKARRGRGHQIAVHLNLKAKDAPQT